MQDVVDMHDNAAADTITLEERVDMLNADQRRVFEKVKSHFLHQQLHEGNKCQCNLEPLRMFVSGVGVPPTPMTNIRKGSREIVSH